MGGRYTEIMNHKGFRDSGFFLGFGVEDLAECVHTLKAVRPYSLRPLLLFWDYLRHACSLAYSCIAQLLS